METIVDVPQEVVQQVANYFSVLSEPMRLRILNLLREGEKCVQDLVDAMDTSQANVSKHLKVMLQAGILNRRTQGTLAYYSVADELSFQLCTLVCDRIACRIEQQAMYFREFSLATAAAAEETRDVVRDAALAAIEETTAIAS
jgi:DNA-binding transcriptional ArsR family regulator